MTFAPGEYIGPYRIIEPLGQGGMATVFKAYHAMLDRYVAIKALHPAFKEDPSFLTRFEREARIVAKLDHPNIIPIYDFAEHEGTPYLVMRYIEGETLKTLLTQQPMPLERVLEILHPVADALSYAHSQGVLHRDIKPSNILLSNDDHIYLTDFGLARTTQPGSSTLSRDMLIGTPQYISPEQAKSEPVDERSDIYSLGVVLFEMLTGQAPFSGDTPYSVIHDHIYSPLPMPSSINPKLSPEVERATLKALAKDPDARYRDARDLLQALELASRTRGTKSNRSSVKKTGTGRPSFPLRRVLLGLDILLAILLVGFFLLNPEMLNRGTTFVAGVMNPPPSATTEPVTNSPVATLVPVVAIEATPTPSPRPTDVATPTSTVTPSPLPSATPTASRTATASPAPTFTQTPKSTPTSTATPLPSPSPTVTVFVFGTVAPTFTPFPTLARPGMVLIPAGVFWMGQRDDDPNSTADEAPGHYVDLSAYYIDQDEVSNADYKKCVDAGACPMPSGFFSAQTPEYAFGNPAFDKFPVVFVSQGNASRFCAFEGKRLPTEAEWEKAARGGSDKRLFPWGDIWDGYRANAAQSKPGPVAVDSYTPEGCSPYGVCNMAGNVAEWVADFYWNTSYIDSLGQALASQPVHDPVNWNPTSGKFVVRGGSFKSIPQNVRVTKRNAWPGSTTLPDIGFRCAQPVK
ncbi:MAG TPA: SUMF1/EgtB/PvdO family nonheme iron enzyme [Anaerolineae bacterium]